MSWKGFTKAVARIPHQIKGATGHSDVSKDPQFQAFEKKFQQLEKKTELLHEDAQKFRDAVIAMLNHEADFAIELADIYQPTMGQQTGEGAILKRVQQTPQQTLQAAHDYREAMIECRDQIIPELDILDRRVIQPTADLREILKAIHKTITKRNHKQIDYDRFKNSLKKLNDKPERSLADEKQIFKLEGQLDVATREFEAVNDALAQELPYFFQLKTEFIDPIFQIFYFTQCRLFALLYNRYSNIIRSGYFNTQLSISAAYETRLGTSRQDLESFQLIRRTGGKTSSSTLDRFGAHPRSSSEATHSELETRVAPRTSSDDGLPPPPYSSQRYSPSNPITSTTAAPLAKLSHPMSGTGVVTSTTASNPSLAATAALKRPPPPPPPASKPAPKFAEALYDYDAQADGDLTFKKGDRIEVIERTPDVNDWWTGRIGGTVGVFPGNYVAEL